MRLGETIMLGLALGLCAGQGHAQAAPPPAPPAPAPVAPPPPAAPVAPAPAAPAPAPTAPPAPPAAAPAPPAPPVAPAPYGTAPVAPAPVAPAPTEPPPAAPPAAPPEAPPPTEAGGSIAFDTSAPAPISGEASRQGLFFSVGVGHSISRWLIDQVVSATGDDGTFRDVETQLGLATKLQIGYTLPVNLALHLTSRLAWLATTRDLGDRSVLVAGVTAVGATYFFQPDAPSAYVTADVGLSHFARFDDDHNLGFGVCGAVGYEIARHWTVENAYCYGTAKQETEVGGSLVGVTGKPFSAFFTVNYLF